MQLESVYYNTEYQKSDLYFSILGIFAFVFHWFILFVFLRLTTLLRIWKRHKNVILNRINTINRRRLQNEITDIIHAIYTY